MKPWQRMTIAGALAVGLVAAVLALSSDSTLEGAPGVSSTLPESLPEWTTTTVASDTTTTSAPPAVELAATGAVLPGETPSVVLHVDPERGADDNDGEEATPFATVARALGSASQFRREGESVRVVLAPGVYRETIELRQDPDDSPLLVIEAAEPGEAVVSGADLFTAWSWSDDDQAFLHPWPFDWGAAPDVEEVVGRREMVVVEGVRLEQVTQARDLRPGTFLVDETTDRLLMLPPDGSTFAGLAAEVAVRERTLNLDSVRHVVVRGITFQHAATPFESSGVRISNSRHVLFEHNRVREHSWTGLGLSTSQSLTIRDNEINENGGGGAGMFQVRDVLFEGNDTSLNNWRGVKGEYVGWSIAGIKAVGIRDVAFVRHRAWWNSTRGLWLDYDVRNVTVDDSSWCHNLTDGLFVEAAPGPVRVSGSESCENGRYGLLLVNVYGATLAHNLVCGNNEAQIHMNAESGGREIVADDGTFRMVAARDLTLDSNRIVGDPPLLDIGIPRADFAELVDTLESDNNEWVSWGRGGFDFPGGSGSLEDWQEATGADASSTWSTGGASCSEPAP
ncbi:MAG TPA: right-handed parallel beta-helix repeat-containing protein [Acidimicrobiia bacterium]|nr:right-handed parallel beta-helix repeat-containing protein [Acidimicrobiia bacterium]